MIDPERKLIAIVDGTFFFEYCIIARHFFEDDDVTPVLFQYHKVRTRASRESRPREHATPSILCSLSKQAVMKCFHCYRNENAARYPWCRRQLIKNISLLMGTRSITHKSRLNLQDAVIWFTWHASLYYLWILYIVTYLISMIY